MNDPWIGSTPYATYCRPKLSDLLESLGLDVVYSRAQGAYLYMDGDDGNEVAVLDLVGGFGAGLLGHNNRELKELLKTRLDANVPFLAQSSQRHEAGVLAEKINSALPARQKYLCHLTNSGAEAVEAAVKHAYKVRFDSLRRLFDRIARDIETFYQKTDRDHPDIAIPGGDRDLGRFRDDLDEYNIAQFELFQRSPVVLALKGSFHGKTATALKVTFNKAYREGFEGLSAVKPVFIDFADVGRLAEIQREHQIEFLVPHVEAGNIVVEKVVATTIIAFCLEVIQGEGGIKPVPDTVLAQLAATQRALGIPLLIDEIQTGCGRTGSFLAYGATPLRDVDPEYITLSKALGGGLVKVGAALIREDIYDQDFGILHTSTFAEDELGSAVACRVVDILTRDDNHFMTQVAAKGRYFLEGLRRLQRRFPDVIREVRGRGLMMGIELAEMDDKSPLFRFGIRQGFLSLLIASYLLRYHRIRVLAPLTTLLKGNPGKKRQSIIRIQPPADITQEEMDRTISALEEVCTIISRNNEGVLVGHLVGVTISAAERSDPQLAPVHRPASNRRVDFDARVGFIIHPPRIEPIQQYYLPTLEGRVRRRNLATWWSRLGRFLEPDVIQADYISSDGFVVETNFVAVPYLARYLHDVYARVQNSPDPERLDLLRLQEVRDKIQDAVTTAKELGDDHIPTSIVGLGAYTSIVTDRGETINDYEVPVTTGNAYTAGLMIQGILNAAALRRIDLSNATAAVVGAAGNIGSVLATLLSNHVGQLKLIGRDSAGSIDRLSKTRTQCLVHIARKARAQVGEGVALENVELGRLGDSVFRHTVLPALRSHTDELARKRMENWLLCKEDDTSEMRHLIEAILAESGVSDDDDSITLHVTVDAVRDCDVITVATNSPEGRLITPELVKQGAVVSCASVPSNLSSAFRDHMTQYFVFDGGYARLPEGNKIDCVGLPKRGLAYGCMCETVLLGFDGRNCSFARGPIDPEQVEHTLSMADLYGFELGEFKLGETPYPAELLAGWGRRRKGKDNDNSRNRRAQAIGA
ncbi:MAG: aminotransferase class III-fold pyridoxal phosphate-dependent enzyme [Gemmatimonadota bacterium]|nr:MAG: aminotransferase class III-fold pyridoxal phosphate-dependent enzyme [Gemmatimonadota bacterium]